MMTGSSLAGTPVAIVIIKAATSPRTQDADGQTKKDGCQPAFLQSLQKTKKIIVDKMLEKLKRFFEIKKPPQGSRTYHSPFHQADGWCRYCGQPIILETYGLAGGWTHIHIEDNGWRAGADCPDGKTRACPAPENCLVVRHEVELWIPGKRVEHPFFEVAANPTIDLSEIARFAAKNQGYLVPEDEKSVETVIDTSRGGNTLVMTVAGDTLLHYTEVAEGCLGIGDEVPA